MASNLARWSPFADFADLHAQIDRLFEEMGDGKEHGWRPAIDVVREDDRIVVKANVPGVKPEDIDIEVDDGMLTISGKHEEEKEEKEKDFVRRERRFGSFSRSIRLPEGVSADDIDASCEHGVLEIAVPVPKRDKKRTVTIKPRS